MLHHKIRLLLPRDDIEEIRFLFLVFAEVAVNLSLILKQKLQYPLNFIEI